MQYNLNECEKVNTLERSLTANDGDRRKLLDQINKLKSSEMRLDGELKRQKEAAELGEMKTTETEVKRRKESSD